MKHGRMHFLVTGAGFSNTGAQAMLFTTVCELKKRFEECRITAISSSPLPDKYKGKLTFDYIESGASEYYWIASAVDKFILRVKNVVKAITNRKVIRINIFEEYVRTADAMIDISGFALGNQWSDRNCLSFLSRIELAQKYKIPIFIMPQSFGSFAFSGKNAAKILQKIEKDMKYPSTIFIREKEGYQLLKKEVGLCNVKLSTDIVLQCPNIEEKLVFKEIHYRKDLFSGKPKGIAIIPNKHCKDYASTNLLKIYKDIIIYLISQGETVYVIRHSEADSNVCQEIKQIFAAERNVILIDEEIDCFEFSESVLHFKYMIASRFHSIVHSYKGGVPCVVIGWAAKYRELLKQFEQEKYVYDIRQQTDSEEILKAVRDMELCWEHEGQTIKRNLMKSSSVNCFDEVKKCLENGEVLNV